MRLAWGNICLEHGTLSKYSGKEKDIAVICREFHKNLWPQRFRAIKGTLAWTPKSSLLRSLLGSTPVVAIKSSNWQGKDFGYILSPVNDVIFVEPSRYIGIERKRIMWAKLFFHIMFGPKFPDFDSVKQWNDLLPEQAAEYFDFNRLQHRFAAEYIFGHQTEFQSVCAKHKGDIVNIAKDYQVPILYVAFQMAHCNIFGNLFLSVSMQNEHKGVIYRYAGENRDLIKKELTNNPQNLLISLLNELPDDYHDTLIHRFTKIHNKHYLCVGKVLSKRGKKRIHVFATDLDYVSTQMIKGIKLCSQSWNYIF